MSVRKLAKEICKRDIRNSFQHLIHCIDTFPLTEDYYYITIIIYFVLFAIYHFCDSFLNFPTIQRVENYYTRKERIKYYYSSCDNTLAGQR